MKTLKLVLLVIPILLLASILPNEEEDPPRRYTEAELGLTVIETKIPTKKELEEFIKKYERERKSKVLDIAFEYISKYESFRPESYYCSAGVKTIGYGTTKYKGDYISEGYAKKLVYNKSSKIYDELLKIIDVYQTEQQLASLISLCYNISIYSFKKSTLLKRINNKASEEQIKREFLKWVNIRVFVDNKSVKKPLRGLIRRRLEEFNSYSQEV